jgi:hypothetical protein
VVTRASGSFATDGLAIGDRIRVAGTGYSQLDNQYNELGAVAATKMTVLAEFPVRNVTSGASATVTATNVITRASGNFTTDGFLVGDVILAGGTTGNVGRAARVRSVAATRITTGSANDYTAGANAVAWDFEAAAASRTLTGPATLTRAAGDWAADGFVVNDAIRVVGSTSNNRDFRVKAVTSATVLRLETGNAVAEGPTSNVGIYKLNEQFARD